MKFRQAQTLLQMIYPSRCLGCGTLVEGDFGLCGACWRETPFVTGVSCDACGVPLLGADPAEIAHCDTCLGEERAWDRGRSVLEYQSFARQLVLRLKHGDRTDMAAVMAQWMARRARDLVCEDMLVVPVPLHWRRMLKRTYNQAALLSTALARELDVDHCPDALKRRVATQPLKGDRDARRQTMRSAIVINPKQASKVQGRAILLVDDVMTSGATLDASARVLMSIGARKVDIITLARVALDH